MIHEIWQGDEQTREESIARTVLARVGTPEDVAYGALFLASKESSFMTGSELVIDGGVTPQERTDAVGRGGALNVRSSPRIA